MAELTSLNHDGMEYTVCEMCGNAESYPVIGRPDFLLGGEQLFYMVECSACHTLYQNPRPTPESINHYYPSQYQPYTKAVAEERPIQQFFRKYGLRKRVQLAQKYHPQGGHLLDVGCSTGDFIAEVAHDPQWCAIGIEPSFYAIHYAHQRLNLHVAQATLNDAPFANKQFDVITMWDVLEHVHDPMSVLAKSAELLKPQGILIINHPNCDSLDRKLFGKYWAGFELPRHITLFPLDILKKVEQQLKLQLVDHYCLYGSHAATGTSLEFFLLDHLPRSLSKLFHTLWFNPLARLIFTPYFKCVDSFNLGSNITSVFRKN